MFVKNLKFLLILFLLYQNPLHSKSASFDNFDSKNLSKYFSGIVAFENKNNSKALNFFNTSKILLNKHEPYLKRYIYSLVLENKVNQAVNIIKQNKNKSEFFEKSRLFGYEFHILADKSVSSPPYFFIDSSKYPHSCNIILFNIAFPKSMY